MNTNKPGHRIFSNLLSFETIQSFTGKRWVRGCALVGNLAFLLLRNPISPKFVATLQDYRRLAHSIPSFTQQHIHFRLGGIYLK